jgi:pseudaminic acid cytidylyltransferase
LRSSTLKRAADLMDTGDFDTAFPVVAFAIRSSAPCAATSTAGRRCGTPEHYASRSPDLEPAYHDPAQLYWMTREVCVTKQPTFAGRAGSFVIDAMEAHDIDTPTDWRLAELKMQLANSGQ